MTSMTTNVLYKKTSRGSHLIVLLLFLLLVARRVCAFGGVGTNPSPQLTSLQKIPKKIDSNDRHPTQDGDEIMTVSTRRRTFFNQVTRSMLGIAIIPSAVCFSVNTENDNTVARAAAGVLKSGQCASGEGEGCEELAGGNEYIRSLQMKSAANRQMYEREALNAYNMKNYPDFFASLNPPKYLVKKSDGTFGVYTDVELDKLQQAGKIKIENPKTMGGKFADLTQKPIMVLVE